MTECNEFICVDKPKKFYDKIFSVSGIFKKRKLEEDYPQRPLFRSEFGRITWNLFHRICAYYPEKPNKNEKELAAKMFEGFYEFFPCKECKIDIPKKIENINNLNSNLLLSKWFVDVHNITNRKLGKKEIEYNNDKLEELVGRFII